MTAVNAKGVTRSFSGLKAVKNVDLEVKKGEVLGIVGPDGAGKTTLIRMLVGVLKSDSGSIEICGLNLEKKHAESRLLVGYMSQAFGLYSDLTVAENINFFASIRQVKKSDRLIREKRLLDFTRLTPFTKRRAGDLSGGMKQKLGLICTLVHEPKVLFLDEPTNGVDPVSRREFWDILGELRGRVTVIVATPYMDEAERCDRVALMSEGKFLAVGSPDQLRATVEYPVWEVSLENPFDSSAVISQTLSDCDVQLFGDLLHIVGPITEKDLSKVLDSLSIPAQIKLITPSMEDAFVQLTLKGA